MSGSKWFFGSILAALMLAAWGCDTEGESVGLPYFSSADLTPEWGRDAEQAHRIASFALTDQGGGRFDSEALDGKVHVASFIYTSCAGICPPMVTNLLEVQSATRDDPGVALVSFSVTPESDTVEALGHFGQMRGIVPGKWHLLTGDRDVIYSLARRSYFAERDMSAAETSFLHTERVFLVDSEGRIRGVYNGARAFDIQRLLEDIALLRGNDVSSGM